MKTEMLRTRRSVAISIVILIIALTLYINIVYEPSLSLHQQSAGPITEPLPSSMRLVELQLRLKPEYRQLVLWSSDFHISPIEDVKTLLKPYGVQIIDKSLSGHCHLMKTCQHDLRVINQQNGIDLGSCPNELRRVWSAY
jgi:hypothetical protein